MRPLDHNEALYVGRVWRALQIVNRVQMIGAAFVALVALGGGGLIGWLAIQRSRVDVFFVVIALVFVAMALGFGFVFVVRFRADSAPPPVPSTAFDIAGPFWEQASARSMTRQGIGDTYLSIPPHWLPLLRRSGSRVLDAEVADGPAETSILLSVNGVLSVSDEVAQGYLSSSRRTALAPLFAAFAVIGFVVAALGALASYDADLTLWRYLQVGSALSRYSSVAELERARPLAFSRVELVGVTLSQVGDHATVAQDEPPAEVGQATQLTGEAERIGRALEQAPCADGTADCSASEQERHAEAVTLELAKLLDGAGAWTERLAAARQGGLAVRGVHELAPDLEPARYYFHDTRRTLGTETDRAQRTQERVADLSAQVAGLVLPGGHRVDASRMIRESARRTVSQQAVADLTQLLPVVERELDDTARAVAVRHTLEGILYRQPSGTEWLAVNARYSIWGLRAQVLACVAAILSAILIPLAAQSLARGKKLIRQLAARLPRSL
jgi:hypothetical protein